MLVASYVPRCVEIAFLLQLGYLAISGRVPCADSAECGQCRRPSVVACGSNSAKFGTMLVNVGQSWPCFARCGRLAALGQLWLELFLDLATYAQFRQTLRAQDWEAWLEVAGCGETRHKSAHIEPNVGQAWPTYSDVGQKFSRLWPTESALRSFAPRGPAPAGYK